MSSRYFVLEGGDGCGKSSQAQTLATALQQQGLDVLHVREPGSTPVGEALRQLLLAPETGELRPITEALLFSAARSELIERVIAPALQAGSTVIAERCYLSTIVYQSAAGDGTLDAAWVRDITARVHGEFMPDRIFVLDVSPKVAEARRNKRTADRFEARGNDYLERVRAGFLEAAAEEERIRVVDADQSFAAVHQALLRQVDEVLR